MDNRLANKVFKEKVQLGTSLGTANVILELPINEHLSGQKEKLLLRDSPPIDYYDALKGHTQLFGSQIKGIEETKDSITLNESLASPVVYRTQEQKSLDPTRLCLDHKNFVICPIIEGEEQLKLLNLQHNCISQIQNLTSLRRLVYLDLYDNRIEEISGLEWLFSLRVLMLGRNRIRHITGLEYLTKLDVLDLHGNYISYIENLGHLCHLRILNLAGNSIAIVDDLSAMQSLSELNLRRNQITHFDCGNLPFLKRLFLSHNLIESLDDISSTVLSSSLTEFSIDGNPFANNPNHRKLIISYLTHLVILNHSPVSDIERKEAVQAATQEEIKINELQKQLTLIKQREYMIESIKEEWEARQINPSLALGNTSYIENEGNMLTLYGSTALEVIKDNRMPIVKHLILHFMDFDQDVNILFHIKESLPTLHTLECHNLNLATMSNLKSLCNCFPSTLTYLTIVPAGNPVIDHPFYSDWITHLLPNVTVNDCNTKHQYFNLYNQFNNKQIFEIHDHEIKQTASILTTAIQYKVHVHHNMKINFNKLWPKIREQLLVKACHGQI